MDKISDLKKIIIKTLDINKAQDIVSIDLKDKSSMADYMIIASGTSSRHIQSLSEQVLDKLIDNGLLTIRASENVVRILPPLNVKKIELNQALEIINKVCKNFS